MRAIVTAAVLALLAAPVLAQSDPSKPTFWSLPDAPTTPLANSLRITVDLQADGSWRNVGGLVFEPPLQAAHAADVCGPSLAPARPAG